MSIQSKEDLIEFLKNNSEIFNIDFINSLDKTNLKRIIKFINMNEKLNPKKLFSFEIPLQDIARVSKNKETGEFKLSMPVSKRPRSRIIQTSGQPIIQVYAADGYDKKKITKEIIKIVEKENIEKLDGQIEFLLEVYLPIPKSFPSYQIPLCEVGYIRPDVKPDYDNYAKIMTDAMNGILFKDDGRIVDGRTALFYSEFPRIAVTIFGRISPLVASEKKLLKEDIETSIDENGF
jgi:Holliday junction resolvase RusA-like endonuclease